MQTRNCQFTFKTCHFGGFRGCLSSTLVLIQLMRDQPQRLDSTVAAGSINKHEAKPPQADGFPSAR